MVTNGSQWFSMVLNAYQWLPVVLNDDQWFSMVTSGSQWFSMVSSGSQWLAVVLFTRENVPSALPHCRRREAGRGPGNEARNGKLGNGDTRGNASVYDTSIYTVSCKPGQQSVHVVKGVASNEAEEAVASSLFCARTQVRIGDIIYKTSACMRAK